MDDTRNLVILSVIMSAAALAISTWSMWPSCKDGFAKFRDAVLWVAFIFVLVGVANYFFRSHRAIPWKSAFGSDRPNYEHPAADPGTRNPTTRDQLRDYSRVDGWTSYAAGGGQLPHLAGGFSNEPTD